MPESWSINLRLISDQAVAVITNPVVFFRTMPKQGGFLEPLMFMVVMGFVSGFLFALGFSLGVNPVAGISMAIWGIVVIPIVVTITSLIVSLLLFGLWKMMGSQERFEVAYRAFAYTYAISPITTVLGFIPYLGIVSIFWTCVLLSVASVEVHRIHPRTAYTVFGLLAVTLAIFAVNVQGQVRSMQRQIWEHSPTAAKALAQKSPFRLP